MPGHIYIEMTMGEVKELPRDKTVFISALSPLEVHGPHLPIGTDIFMAETIRDRLKAALSEKRPDLHIVLLPTLPLGSQPIPAAGSFNLRPAAIEIALMDWGRALRKLGFNLWVLCDNHGDPRHQLAIAAAAGKLAAKRFTLLAPFNYVFRHMISLHPDLLATGLRQGNCGDVSDSHAGTNETSLMRAAHPGKVRDLWKTTGPAKEPPFKLPHRVLEGVSRFFGKLGLEEASRDFHFFAHGLAWISDPQMDPYQGDPSASSPENGELMIGYHVNTALRLAEQSLDGNPPAIHPMGWSARALRRLI